MIVESVVIDAGGNAGSGGKLASGNQDIVGGKGDGFVAPVGNMPHHAVER